MESGQESRSGDLAIQVLQAAAESATEQVAAEGGKRLLAELISSALVGPAAAILAAVAKTFVQELFRQTNAIEAKLDRILSEPMGNAVNTLTETLSARFETEDEFAECNRRLADADDSLRVAYEYARKTDSSKLTLIRAYQALIAALLVGGRPYLKLYLQDLRNRAKDEVQRTTAEADEAEANPINLDRRPVMPVPEVGNRRGNPLAYVQVARENRIERLRAKAKRLLLAAEQVELFCILL